MEFNPFRKQALAANPEKAEQTPAAEESNVVQMPEAVERTPVTDSFGNVLGMAGTPEEAKALIRQAAEDRKEAA